MYFLQRTFSLTWARSGWCSSGSSPGIRKCGPPGCVRYSGTRTRGPVYSTAVCKDEKRGVRVEILYFRKTTFKAVPPVLTDLLVSIVYCSAKLIIMLANATPIYLVLAAAYSRSSLLQTVFCTVCFPWKTTIYIYERKQEKSRSQQKTCYPKLYTRQLYI